jgi:hypothetical protein
MPSFEAPGNLWQYLGERTGQPFVPFTAQAEVFQRVKIPWPGMVRWQDHPKYSRLPALPELGPEYPVERRESGLYVPYPQIFPLNMGRRFGKTTLGEKFLWQGLFAGEDFFGPPTVRMTADTEEHARKIWDRFIRHLLNTDLKGFLDVYNRDRELVTLKNGATAQLLSGNNPDTLAGDGVTLWIIDEMQATEFSQAAWDSLFPSISERNGVIIPLGVAQNSGPFRSVSFWGKDNAYPEFYTMNMPTRANPFVPQRMIDFALRTLGPTRFAQLYLAKWVGELGQLFRNVRGNLNHKPYTQHEKGWYFSEPPLLGREYVYGIDLGNLSDWTVVSIWRPNGELVAWDRFNEIDWELQKHRARELVLHYGLGKLDAPSGMVDSTGVGEPIYDDLVRMGLNVQAYQIGTNVKKRVLVDDWVIRMGAGHASYPEIPEMIQEHENFEATKTPGGVVQYGAPAGLHDDWVLSAALANKVMPPHNLPAADPSEFETSVYVQDAEWDKIRQEA